MAPLPQAWTPGLPAPRNLVKVGIGFSRVPSLKEAGAEAAGEACRFLEKPVLTFLFTTEEYDQEDVLEGVLSQIGGSCLVGACGAGIVTPQGIYREGVAVLVFGGEGVSAVSAAAPFGNGDAEETGKRLGESLLGKASGREGTVFTFPDGLANHIGEMLCGLYDVLGPEFRYIGGATGDNLRFMKTYQMTEHGVVSSSVAAALVAGYSFGIGVGHGWKSVGAPLIITEARGRVLYELDEQPAFEVYFRRLGGLTPENFAKVGAKHPLGITDASGKYIIRDPLKILPGFALIFDCVSRSLFLGNGSEEVAVIRQVLGSLPFVGFLTFGEIASYDNVPLFHNKSLVIAVGGE